MNKSDLPALVLRRAARISRLAAALLTMTVTSCSPAAILNATANRTGLEITRDLPYGSDPRQKLDIYAPKTAHDAPVIVFFYGGGWTDGTKSDYVFLATALAARGFVTIIPDYRLYPQIRYPGFLQDGAQAVHWAKAHARDYGGDPARMILSGHSAGAYIAVMLAVDPQWLGVVGLNPQHDLRAVIGLSGPYDFLPLRDDTLRAIFGSGTALLKTQPVNLVTGPAPPMLLLTGGNDETVYPRNTAHLAARLRAAGSEVETIIYPRLDHRMMVGAFAWPLRFKAPVLDDVTRYAAAKTR